MKSELPAFDVLVEMARNNPEGLEKLRRSLTEAVIESASTERTKKRLKGLQFRVDMERERAATPLAATIKISEMMCKSLADLHRSMVAPDLGISEANAQDRESATVIGFPSSDRPGS